MRKSAGRLLVIAGHDPTGGAGVDADREAARHFGLPASLVVTAYTEQGDGVVRSIGPRQASIWLREARAACRPRPLAIKTGLLPGAEHVGAVARLIEELAETDQVPPVVVDPCLAASGGEVFLDGPGREALLERLLPLGCYLTPNLPEAAELTGRRPDELQDSLEARIEAARELLEKGARAVILKGGHGSEDPLRELVLDADGARWLERPRVPGPGIHGSGCRFASAFAARIAQGAGVDEAASDAGEWLSERIAASG